MNHRLLSRILLLILTGTMVIGCSLRQRETPPAPTSKKSKKSSRVAATGQTDQFCGKWAGTWQSEENGHHGNLKCTLTKVDDTHHQAKFTAYWLTLHSTYSVILETHRHGETLSFEGKKDLGKVYGGLYKYDGKVTAQDFTSTYLAPVDHGTFTMERAVD